MGQGRLQTTLPGTPRRAISRRVFLERAAALGVATPVALGVLRLTDVAAQEATPEAAAAAAAPATGTDGQTRGAGGELKLLQWQAPTTLNMQLAGSFKDQLASCLVTEPLIHFLPDATPIPCLVKEVPSQENGLRRRRLHDRHLQPAGRDRLERWRAVDRRATSSSPGNGSSIPPTNRRNSALYEAIAIVEAVDDHHGQDHLQGAATRLEQLFLVRPERRHLARACPRRGRRCGDHLRA